MGPSSLHFSPLTLASFFTVLAISCCNAEPAFHKTNDQSKSGSNKFVVISDNLNSASDPSSVHDESEITNVLVDNLAQSEGEGDGSDPGTTASTALPGTVASDSPNASTNATTTNHPTSLTTKKPIQVQPNPEDLYCYCDLHKSTCDMNCCCDSDCTMDDRQFFTICVEDGSSPTNYNRSSSRRQRSCYKSFSIFTHYAQNKGVTSDNGLLCIVTDNNKNDNLLPLVKIKEVRERITRGEINIQPKYSLDGDKVMQYKNETYKYGSPILAVRGIKDKLEDFFAFGLPSNFHGVPCEKLREPVKFLEPFHSKCLLGGINMTEDCLKLNVLHPLHFIKEIQIWKNPADPEPSFTNITLSTHCGEESCRGQNQSNGSQTLDPSLTSGFCTSVLKRLEMVFYFNLQGITKVTAIAETANISIVTTELLQEYRAKFKWDEGPTNTSTVVNKSDADDWPRSGNPGYIVGKPIVMGEKVLVPQPSQKLQKDGTGTEGSTTTSTESTVGEEEMKDKEMVLLWTDSSRWMSIHAPGVCAGNTNTSERNLVLFDYSHVTTCFLNVSMYRYCEDLQSGILKILYGTKEPSLFEKRPWLVAAFGNSNPDVPNEWVPLTLTKSFLSPPKADGKTLIVRGCPIIPSLHITITYAFVGTLDSPQAKITGAFYEPGEAISIPPEDSSTSITVYSTVSFKDVTGPPVTRIAKWPSLYITLPKGFFYPFFT